MTIDQIIGWNMALDMLADWLKAAIESEAEPGAEPLRVAWGEVLTICQNERKISDV